MSVPKKLRRQLYFSRTELSLILAAYSARVAAGEWRDYALDHMNGVALFSIFRHTHENPLFVIERNSATQRKSRSSCFATEPGFCAGRTPSPT